MDFSASTMASDSVSQAELPTIDFIVPCFNEKDNVEAFYKEFAQTFESIAQWRLIMIDDGSTDGTYEELEAIACKDYRVTVIEFSRNFGKEAAIYAGLKQLQADYAGIIDADLQQPPIVAKEMIGALIANPSIDCVAAYQEVRREGLITGALKQKFYTLFAHSSQTNAVANASDFRVFRREVARALLLLPEYYRFSKGIFAWIGFNTLPWPYAARKRIAGQSKWTFRSLLRYATEGLLSFTTEPLHFITKLGFTTSLAATIYAIIVIGQTLILGIDLPGYASLICLVLLFGGAQLFAIGVIGEYLGRAYIQGKHRPVYLVRREINPAKNENVEPAD